MCFRWQVFEGEGVSVVHQRIRDGFGRAGVGALRAVVVVVVVVAIMVVAMVFV